jgi:ASC-1-like (ASCH) protein
LLAKKDTLELIKAGKKRIKFGDKMISEFEQQVKQGEFEKKLL